MGRSLQSYEALPAICDHALTRSVIPSSHFPAFPKHTTVKVLKDVHSLLYVTKRRLPYAIMHTLTHLCRTLCVDRRFRRTILLRFL